MSLAAAPGAVLLVDVEFPDRGMLIHVMLPNWCRSPVQTTKLAVILLE